LAEAPPAPARAAEPAPEPARAAEPAPAPARAAEPAPVPAQAESPPAQDKRVALAPKSAKHQVPAGLLTPDELAFLMEDEQ